MKTKYAAGQFKLPSSDPLADAYDEAAMHRVARMVIPANGHVDEKALAAELQQNISDEALQLMMDHMLEKNQMHLKATHPMTKENVKDLAVFALFVIGTTVVATTADLAWLNSWTLYGVNLIALGVYTRRVFSLKQKDAFAADKYEKAFLLLKQEKLRRAALVKNH